MIDRSQSRSWKTGSGAPRLSVMSTDITPPDVVAFWKEAGPKMWFAKEDAFDALFHDRFREAHRSEEHTSELQSRLHLVCRLLLDTATTEIYTLSLHDALPIYDRQIAVAVMEDGERGA